MPAAAEAKFCTASAAIWTRSLSVDSPLYACQFVFVVKLTAVLNARSGGTWPAPNPCGLSGRCPWSRWKAYTNRKEKRLKDSRDAAYCVQRCSSSSRTPHSL